MANILTHTTQSNFLSGVLDPRTQGRVDTTAYISSMLEGTNVELSHLGGVSRRRGMPYCATMPNRLSLLSGTYTVPNGGTFLWSPAGNSYYVSAGAPATAGVALGSSQWGTYSTTTTTGISTNNPYVVVLVDLGSAQTVLFADVVGLSLSAGASSTQFAIQYSTDNSTWVTVPTGGALPQLDSSNGTPAANGMYGGPGYTYRAVGPITARYWRVARVGATNLGTDVVGIADFSLWADSGVVSGGRLLSFEVSVGEQYLIAVTDRSGNVFNANTGGLVQQIALPYASADLPLVDAQASAESMGIVHQTYAPLFVIRQTSPLAPSTTPQYGTYYNFQAFPMVFDLIPQVYYADSKSPTPTSDIQTFQFNNGWVVGDTFTVTLLTDTTGPIVYSGDGATTATAIQTAVQALWAVNGFSGVSVVSNGSYAYTVTFANAAAAPIGAIAITSLSSNATATATETQVGISAQENVWSPVRGYPGTISFFQGRMYFGGLLSQPESIVGSWVNSILNFSTAQGLDDQAIYVTMNGVALNAVNGLFPGKSLCVFTTGGEFRFVNDQNQPVVPTSSPTNQTQYGGAHIKPVMLDGNIIFVQRNLNSIRDFQFDYTVDQYNSLGVSALVPNLIYNVRDIAAWQGAIEEELNLLFICNGTNPSTDFDAYPSGSCSVYNTRKEVGVQAWVNWQTQGLYKNVVAVVENIFFLVQRVLNGVTVLTLEQPTQNTYMDCSYYTAAATAGQTQISGLTWLNGMSVRVLADGYVLDTQTISGGVCPLTSGGVVYTTAGGVVEIGLNFNPTVTPMPLQTVRFPTGTNLTHKKRIVAIRAKVRETQGLYANGNLLQLAQLDNFSMDSGPLPLYTGVVELEESTNWDQEEDKMVTFTQVDPLPMQILFLDVELSGEQ